MRELERRGEKCFVNLVIICDGFKIQARRLTVIFELDVGFVKFGSLFCCWQDKRQDIALASKTANWQKHMLLSAKAQAQS